MRYVFAALLAVLALFTFPAPARLADGSAAAWAFLGVSSLCFVGAAWLAFASKPEAD